MFGSKTGNLGFWEFRGFRPPLEEKNVFSWLGLFSNVYTDIQKKHQFCEPNPLNLFVVVSLGECDNFWSPLVFGTNMFTRFQNFRVGVALENPCKFWPGQPKKNWRPSQRQQWKGPEFFPAESCSLTNYFWWNDVVKLYFMTWTHLKFLGVKLPHLRYNNVLLWKNTLMADWTVFFRGVPLRSCFWWRRCPEENWNPLWTRGRISCSKKIRLGVLAGLGVDVRCMVFAKGRIITPWKLTYPLKIDGCKMKSAFEMIKMVPLQGTC